MDDWQIERDKLARLLQDVIDTMELGGCFHDWVNADMDSGLPFVWHQLCAARDIAVSQASPGVALEPASHRLQ